MTVFPHYKTARPKIFAAVEADNSVDDRFGYLDGYPALISLFQKLDFRQQQDVLAGAYAVYGWMPRTLKYDKLNQSYKELADFCLAKYEDPSSAIENSKRSSTIHCVLNNSIVGTSKFLHFAKPSVFPIWDSKIAAYFGCKTTIVENYIDYCQTLHKFLSTEKFDFKFLPHQVREPVVSDLRRLEFCLFRVAH